MLIFIVIGCEKDDRDLGCFFALPDHLRQLEAGGAGHPDIQNKDSEFIGKKRKQCLFRRFRPDQPIARGIQDGLQHGEILRLVVHDQNID